MIHTLLQPLADRGYGLDGFDGRLGERTLRRGVCMDVMTAVRRLRVSGREVRVQVRFGLDNDKGPTLTVDPLSEWVRGSGAPRTQASSRSRLVEVRSPMP